MPRHRSRYDETERADIARRLRALAARIEAPSRGGGTAYVAMTDVAHKERLPRPLEWKNASVPLSLCLAVARRRGAEAPSSGTYGDIRRRTAMSHRHICPCHRFFHRFFHLGRRGAEQRRARAAQTLRARDRLSRGLRSHMSERRRSDDTRPVTRPVSEVRVARRPSEREGGRGRGSRVVSSAWHATWHDSRVGNGWWCRDARYERGVGGRSLALATAAMTMRTDEQGGEGGGWPWSSLSRRPCL